ncbi:MAG: hypothetical protein DRJ05_09860, partial [Bacteroidetes bacterium]
MKKTNLKWFVLFIALTLSGALAAQYTQTVTFPSGIFKTGWYENGSYFSVHAHNINNAALDTYEPYSPPQCLRFIPADAPNYHYMRIEKTLNPYELHSMYLKSITNEDFYLTINGRDASGNVLYTKEVTLSTSYQQITFTGWTGVNQIHFVDHDNSYTPWDGFKVDDINYTVGNSAPTDITMDDYTVENGDPVGTAVGNFITTDPDDPNTTNTYIFAAGGADNGSFTIDGTALKTAFVADYDTKNTYNIKIRTTDVGGLYFEKDLTVFVNPSAIIWDGPTITFTKANYADYELEANQDRMTDNVWITREESYPIFNIKTESYWSTDDSPLDTEWASGDIADYATLSYEPFKEWLDGSIGSNVVGNNAVLHLISENIYLSIVFTWWQGGGNGGGFTLERSTPVVLPTGPDPVTAFPFNEDFESGAFPSTMVPDIQSQSDLTLTNYAAANSSTYGAMFEGGPSYWASTPGTVDEAFAYVDHVAKLEMIIEPDGSPGQLQLGFDLVQRCTFNNVNYEWF